jgi:phage baseplate assembly protein W
MRWSGATLGTGWRFPIQLDTRGGVAMAGDEEKIRESIQIILSTAKGERVMRPEFGCDIHAFVFAGMDRTTCTMIESAVREALVLWEPRIEVESVRVTTERSGEGIMDIALRYRIRATNSEFNLVYPFYHQAGA